MAEVVGLHGQTIYELPEKSDKLIEELQGLLRRAEAGELISMIFVCGERDMLTTTAGYVGHMGYALVGRAYCTLHRLEGKLERGLRGLAPAARRTGPGPVAPGKQAAGPSVIARPGHG